MLFFIKIDKNMNMSKHYKQPFPIFLKADNVYKYFTEFSGRSFNILFYNKHLYLYLKKKIVWRGYYRITFIKSILLSFYGLVVLNGYSKSSLGKLMPFSEHQNCLLCQNRAGFCFLQATYHLTDPESDTDRGSVACLRFGFFSSPAARAVNYV